MLYQNYLMHHGVKGQKWGVRNGPPYPIEKRIFISGSSKTQIKDSGYYRKKLPKPITDKIDNYISDNARILVGDAPGIDTQVQSYLANKKYRKVDIYTTEGEPRANADYLGTLGWTIHKVPSKERDFKKRLVAKDIAMTKDSTEGLAVILDEGATATRNNISRLDEQSKPVSVFQLNRNKHDEFIEHSDDFLCHHGIKGQKWGVKHGPPYPLDKKTNRLIRRSRNNAYEARKFEDFKDTAETSKLIRDQNMVQEAFPKLKRLSKPESIDASLNAVNPDVHGEGRNFNCQNSATALELRRRGYDVEARRRDDGSNLGNMESWFVGGEFSTVNDKKNAKDPFYKKYRANEAYLALDPKSKEYKAFEAEWHKRQNEAYSDFCKELMKQPVGARGIWFAGWTDYVGDIMADNWKDVCKINPSGGSFFHAMNYEITKNGPIFYDSQSKRHKVMKDTEWNPQSTDPREYSYMRTDNLELSPTVVDAVISKGR